MVKQSDIILNQLAEQGFWHNDISLYLTLIQQSKSIRVWSENLAREVELDPEQGWQFIKEWAIANNFSLSKRGSRRSQIDNLLGDISNRQKLESEAASSLNSLKAKAREGTPPGAAPALSTNLQKAELIQSKQIKDLESRLFDPMTTFYYNSPMLKDIGDADLRMRAATVLSANPQLVAYYNPSHQSAGRTHLSQASNQLQPILGRAIPELAPLYYTLRSDEMEAKTEKTLADAKTELRKIYPGYSQDQINLKDLDRDMSHFYKVARSGSSLSDISDIINALPPAYLTQDVRGLDQMVRQIVVRAATGTHVSGSDLLAELIREGKLSPQAALQLQFLAPRLELAQINIRAELSGSDLLDRTNTREKWSANLAESLGINPSTFWLKGKDLAEAEKYFLGLPEYAGATTLEQALGMELDRATNLDRYNELAKLKDQSAQWRDYRQARSDNTLFYLQDQMNKFGYGLQVTKEPYDKASRRFWSHVDKIDDIINYPQRKVLDYWEELVDGRKKFLGLKTVIEFKNKAGNIVRIPLLDLPHFAFMQFNGLQKYLAENVFKWSWGLAKQGGVFTPLKGVANYTFAFIQHDGDFRSTNFYFGRKAMGNFLDWGAKKLGHANFLAMKKWGGEGLLKVGNKITGGLLGKATAYLASLGLSVEGIGIFLTAAMLAVDLVKSIGGFFKKFFNDENFRNKFLNWAPAIAVFFGGVGAFLGGIPAAIAFGFTGLLAFLASAISGIALFFVQGFIWAGAAVLSILLIFQVFKLTTNLDSQSALQQIAVNLLCDNDNAGAEVGTEIKSSGSSVASCANCLAKYLSECYGQSVTSSNISKGLSCLAAKAIAPQAIEEIRRSAEGYTYLQCVGFVQASLACGGAKRLGAGNACDFIGSGSGFVSGSSGARVGSVCMLASSNGACTDEYPGHIFIVNEDKGALVGAADANNRLSCGASGCVSSTSVYPKSSIAGCLVN